MLLVLGLTVFVDLITAVGVGVVLAALAYVKQVAQLQLDEVKKIPDTLQDPEEDALLKQTKGKVQIFSFGGPLSFGAAADLGHHVREKVSRGSSALILDFSRVPTMDVSAAMAVETITSDAKAAGRQVLMCGAVEAVNTVLNNINAHQSGVTVCVTRKEALAKAVEMVNQPGKAEGSGSATQHLASV